MSLMHDPNVAPRRAVPRGGAGTRVARATAWSTVLTAAAFAWLSLYAPSARGDVAFTATSSAQGSQVEIRSRSIPLSTDTSGGGPTAQTLLDSNGSSRAYAASPDPSPTGATAPALACSLSGLPVPPAACTYPLFATTDRGQPPQSAGQVGNHVSAESKDTSASAAAVLGEAPGPQANVTSTTSALGDGVITTRAEMVADAVNVGNGVVMRGVHVLAQAVFANGKVTTKQELRASEITVNGQTFGFSNGAFTLPGGSGVRVPADAVFALMKQVGVTGQFEQAVQTPTGVVSASLAFAYDLPATSATVPARVSVTLGRASANIMGSAAPGGSSDRVTSPSAVPGDAVLGGGSPAGGGQSGVLQDPNPGPVTGSGASAAPSSSTPSAPLAPVKGPPVRSAPHSLGLAPTASANHQLSNIYLALALSAMATFAMATGVRLLGVKLPWRI